MSLLVIQCERRVRRGWWAASVLALTLAAVGCATDGESIGEDAEGDDVAAGEQRSALDAGSVAEIASDAGVVSASDAGSPTPGSDFSTADPARAGSFATETQRNVGPDGGFTLVRPSALTSGKRHPIITWGNGTGASPSTYTSLLNRLASHGFVVIASNSPNTGSANEMLQGVDWLLAQNGAQGSALYQKLDAERIGATGHSQGGFGTCAATRDRRISTIAPLQGFRPPAASYRGTTFAVAGRQDTIVTPTGIEGGFDRYNGGPAIFGELASATHTNWMRGTGEAGAAMNEAVVAWMRVHLMNDQTLRSRFYGPGCGYCRNTDWRVKQKGMQ